MKSKVVIVDYNMGNVHSVYQACKKVGLNAMISSDTADIENSNAVILPGVGAYATAMKNIVNLGLDVALVEHHLKNKPIFGICLGLQLLFTKSEEFGEVNGLSIVPGKVVKISNVDGCSEKMKVPQIGWNQILSLNIEKWSKTPLNYCQDGEFQYFVHSYVCVPDLTDSILSYTNYSGVEFCSSITFGSNVFATQFHPEKSGRKGLSIYESWAVLNNLQ